jgi:hypothetical protein
MSKRKTPPDGRELRASAISEAEFQRRVIKAAHALGWMVAHFRPSMNRRGQWMTAVSADGAGFPDLVLVHRASGDLIFAELKSESGKLTEAQTVWLDALGRGGLGRAFWWRPSEIDAIIERLKR